MVTGPREFETPGTFSKMQHFFFPKQFGLSLSCLSQVTPGSSCITFGIRLLRHAWWTSGCVVPAYYFLLSTFGCRTFCSTEKLHEAQDVHLRALYTSLSMWSIATEE